MSTQKAGPLFRSQADYAAPPYHATVEGDVFACTTRGVAVKEGWVVGDTDGLSYRRSGAIVQGDPAALMVQQPGTALAAASLAPDTFAAPETGAASNTFAVTTGADIDPWLPLPDVDWITVSDPVIHLIGGYTVTYDVAAQKPGPRPARTGHINIAELGLTFTVNQAAGTLAAQSESVPSDPPSHSNPGHASHKPHHKENRR